LKQLLEEDTRPSFPFHSQGGEATCTISGNIGETSLTPRREKFGVREGQLHKSENLFLKEALRFDQGKNIIFY
jgi:hypothetical protein